MSPTAAKTRLLLRVELRALIYRSEGTFYADAPQFGIWCSGKTIQEAVNGLFDGIIVTLNAAIERGKGDVYLGSRGFSRKSGIYRFDDENVLFEKHIADIEWAKLDPDRGRCLFMEAKFIAHEVADAFFDLKPPMVWQQMRKPETQLQVC